MTDPLDIADINCDCSLVWGQLTIVYAPRPFYETLYYSIGTAAPEYPPHKNDTFILDIDKVVREIRANPVNLFSYKYYQHISPEYLPMTIRGKSKNDICLSYVNPEKHADLLSKIKNGDAFREYILTGDSRYNCIYKNLFYDNQIELAILGDKHNGPTAHRYHVAYNPNSFLREDVEEIVYAIFTRKE